MNRIHLIYLIYNGEALETTSYSVVNALLHKGLNIQVQLIPLVGLRGKRANQFNNTAISMSIRTRFI